MDRRARLTDRNEESGDRRLHEQRDVRRPPAGMERTERRREKTIEAGDERQARRRRKPAAGGAERVDGDEQRQRRHEPSGADLAGHRFDRLHDSLQP